MTTSSFIPAKAHMEGNYIRIMDEDGKCPFSICTNGKGHCTVLVYGNTPYNVEVLSTGLRITKK